MVERIFLCIPMIFRLIPVMFMIFYFWAVIGIENFNTETNPHRAGSHYITFEYATMNNFYGALMLLF